MEKFVLFVILFFYCCSALAYSSKASKFAESEYAKANNCAKVCINMKKEFSDDYKLKTEPVMITKIVYGWGDIKINGCKKRRAAYIVLYDKSGNSYWSSINFYK